MNKYNIKELFTIFFVDGNVLDKNQMKAFAVI